MSTTMRIDLASEDVDLSKAICDQLKKISDNPWIVYASDYTKDHPSDVGSKGYTTKLEKYGFQQVHWKDNQGMATLRINDLEYDSNDPSVSLMRLENFAKTHYLLLDCMLAIVLSYFQAYLSVRGKEQFNPLWRAMIAKYLPSQKTFFIGYDLIKPFTISPPEDKSITQHATAKLKVAQLCYIHGFSGAYTFHPIDSHNGENLLCVREANAKHSAVFRGSRSEQNKDQSYSDLEKDFLRHYGKPLSHGDILFLNWLRRGQPDKKEINSKVTNQEAWRSLKDQSGFGRAVKDSEKFGNSPSRFDLSKIRIPEEFVETKIVGYTGIVHDFVVLNTPTSENAGQDNNDPSQEGSNKESHSGNHSQKVHNKKGHNESHKKNGKKSHSKKKP